MQDNTWKVGIYSIVLLRTVHNKWKHDKVIHLYNAGARDDINNYRLISILPIMSKIFKKAVQHQLSDYLEKVSLISIFQCSFRPRYFAQSAIRNLIAQREEI